MCFKKFLNASKSFQKLWSFTILVRALTNYTCSFVKVQKAEKSIVKHFEGYENIEALKSFKNMLKLQKAFKKL